MKALMILLFAIVIVTSLTVEVYAWGAITHSYFAKQLGYRWGVPNLQEIYGSTLPDMFNLMYGSPYKDYLWTQTHYEFEKVTSGVYGKYLEAFEVGFRSHNDLNGADYTAHHDARTMPGIGYIIAKVNDLTPLLMPQLVDILTAAGVPNAVELAEEAAPGLAENFAETAVDLLVKRNEDQLIGYRLSLAAQMRDFRIPFQINRAYAADFASEFGLWYFEASAILIGAEAEYRELMKLYGGIFTKGEEEAIALLAGQGALLAAAFIKAETGLDVTIPPEPLAAFLRDVTIPVLEPDYAAEIAATLAYLEGLLGATSQDEAPVFPLIVEGDEPGTPGAYDSRLKQNFPNPFNPTTTIGYSLSVGGRVRLAVYDVSGREVAVLVDGYKSKGDYSVVWNARGLPSGIYFYRITRDGFTATRKMCLMK